MNRWRSILLPTLFIIAALGQQLARFEVTVALLLRVMRQMHLVTIVVVLKDGGAVLDRFHMVTFSV